ncbi:MAG TPA: ATP-binding protein, partial [Polyangiaceae bacterium]|nr:ATP-binding protein [Polyangiaceae bacterium]
LVDEVAASLRRQLVGRDVRVEAALDAGLGPVRADRELVRRVLVNLVDNALRHSPRGGVVVVAGARAGGRVRLEVRDRGPGVPPAQRAALFDAYETSPDPDGHGRRGHGLGLAFCRLAAEAHGGRADYERSEGGESVFFFELPA